MLLSSQVSGCLCQPPWACSLFRCHQPSWGNSPGWVGGCPECSIYSVCKPAGLIPFAFPLSHYKEEIFSFHLRIYYIGMPCTKINWKDNRHSEERKIRFPPARDRTSGKDWPTLGNVNSLQLTTYFHLISCEYRPDASH